MLSEEDIRKMREQTIYNVTEAFGLLYDHSAEITRLKAEIERLKGENKYAGEWEGKYLEESPICVYGIFCGIVLCRHLNEKVWWITFIEPRKIKSLIDSGVMKRVSKAEPSPLTSVGGSK